MEFDLSFIINSLGGIFAEIDPNQMADDEVARFIEKFGKVGDAIDEQTGDASKYIKLLILPIAIFFAFYAIKIIFSTITKATDSAGAGISGRFTNLKERLEKLRGPNYSDEEYDFEGDDGDLDEPIDEPAKEAEITRELVKQLLFGEVITKYVSSAVRKEDIEDALAIQGNGDSGKKLGEILIDTGKLTRLEVSQALKIQETRKGGA